jgi:hypothetical protein
MTGINDGVIRIIETLIVSGILALGGYLFAVLRLHRKIDKTRDIKLDKLVSYHEGIPADNFLGLPAVPGLNDRLSKQEMINGELAAVQQEILEMVHTGNGKTIGQKVDNIEHIATRAEAAAAEASGKADHQQGQLDQLNQLVEDSLALQEAHLNDGKTVMEIGVINDENEWEALREHGINMPDYVYPPEDLAFSLEDLRKRKEE